MNKMFERMMSGMMKPEDMPQMMDTMMDKMFLSMSAEDRIQFVTTMMPKCLNMIFSELDLTAREKLAREMINKMANIFEEQLGENKGAKR
ncbi:hypothetical protein [Stygiobacter electus]|uniref:Uncharacterized protein n=1 Tax=Stygiobacter electus TaxID=3032292 RepID=A0AAE3NWI0_9BACT|nr:hypothetical protein [Stygiobacter electus]MDF1611361.1 hypothetical protein [Stygiobacter electus]